MRGCGSRGEQRGRWRGMGNGGVDGRVGNEEAGEWER